MPGVTELLTVEELAERWRVSRATIWRLHRVHGMPGVRPAGDLRFEPEAVQRWLESRRVTA